MNNNHRTPNVVQVFDSGTQKLLHKYTDDQSAHVFTVAYSPDGTRLACGGTALSVWDTVKGEILSSIADPSATSSLCFSPDGKRLYSGHAWEGSLAVWNIRGDQLELAKAFNSEGDNVFAVACSRDGKWLVAGHDSGKLVVYDPLDLAVRAELNGHSRSVQSLAFSPDDKSMISGGKDGVVKIWQVGSWKEAAKLQHTDEIRALRFIAGADQRIGLVVGTHSGESIPANVQVHWIEDKSSADWSWLRH